jgi:hypothetical protein
MLSATSASMSPAAAAPSATMIAAAATGRSEVGAARANLGGDFLFIAVDLLGPDLAVTIDVELLEETARVGQEFGACNLAVAILVRLFEPCLLGRLLAGSAAKRFAHRAYEGQRVRRAHGEEQASAQA